MSEYDPEQPHVRDVADYIRDMAEQLADMARGAGLSALAGELDRTRHMAEATLEGMDAAAPERAAR